MTFAEVAAIENARARIVWGDDEGDSRNSGLTKSVIAALLDGPKDVDEIAAKTGKVLSSVRTVLSRGVRSGRVSVDKSARPYRYSVRS